MAKSENLNEGRPLISPEVTLAILLFIVGILLGHVFTEHV